MELKNAGATFQRFLNEILRETKNCFCYLDNVLIFSKTREGYFRHLSEDLNQLNYYGFILNKNANFV